GDPPADAAGHHQHDAHHVRPGHRGLRGSRPHRDSGRHPRLHLQDLPGHSPVSLRLRPGGFLRDHLAPAQHGRRSDLSPADRALLDNLAFIPIAFPGIVLGVSLIWVSLTLVPVIYGTFWLLLIAYITRFMPYGIRAASASMVQIHDDLEEAALACGSSWRQAFQRIILPLLMPGFVAGWIYVSTVSLRELSTSILLYSPDSIVLAILAFDMWEGGQYNYVAAN